MLRGKHENLNFYLIFKINISIWLKTIHKSAQNTSAMVGKTENENSEYFEKNSSKVKKPKSP